MPGKPKQPVRKQAPRPAASKSSASQRAAAQRAVASASGSRSNRWWTVGAPIVVIVVIVAALVITKASEGKTKPKSGVAATTAQATVASQVTSVPASVLDEVGLGSISTPPTSLSGAALTVDGKPRVLFVGAEWCPYCAAERWPLTVALSRFGSLTGLGEVSSSPTDVDPKTATLTFHGATYTSTYLSLTAKEIYSNQVSGSSYAPLDTLTAADQALFTSVGKGSFPFIDIGGKYLFAASYDPGILAGLTQAQIAADLSQPNSSIGKTIDGAANLITAAICATTANTPSSVCTASGVVAAAKLLPGKT